MRSRKKRKKTKRRNKESTAFDAESKEASEIVGVGSFSRSHLS